MKHILFELEGCPYPTLNDEEHIKFCLFHATEASHSKVIKIETQVCTTWCNWICFISRESFKYSYIPEKVLHIVTFLLVVNNVNQKVQ